jgi:hypothetical protein
MDEKIVTSESNATPEKKNQVQERLQQVDAAIKQADQAAQVWQNELASSSSGATTALQDMAQDNNTSDASNPPVTDPAPVTSSAAADPAVKSSPVIPVSSTPAVTPANPSASTPVSPPPDVSSAAPASNQSEVTAPVIQLPASVPAGPPAAAPLASSAEDKIGDEDQVKRELLKSKINFLFSKLNKLSAEELASIIKTGRTLDGQDPNLGTEFDSATTLFIVALYKEGVTDAENILQRLPNLLEKV